MPGTLHSAHLVLVNTDAKAGVVRAKAALLVQQRSSRAQRRARCMVLEAAGCGRGVCREVAAVGA